PRRYCCSASLASASAACSDACCWLPESVTRGALAATSSPLSKCTRSTVSLTLAVIVTDSRALTVPSAEIVSLQGCRVATCVVTTAAGAASPAAADAASPPHAAGSRHRPDNSRIGNDGKRKSAGMSTRRGETARFYRPAVKGAHAKGGGDRFGNPVNRGCTRALQPRCNDSGSPAPAAQGRLAVVAGAGEHRVLRLADVA